MNASYTHPGILPRKYGRYEQDLLPMFCYATDGDKVAHSDVGAEEVIIGTFKVVGECTRTDPMWGTVHAAECVEITLNDGTVVPATRLKGEPNYVFCQDRSFGAAKPDPTLANMRKFVAGEPQNQFVGEPTGGA